MGIHWPFARHEQPQPLRAIVATRSESVAIARKKAETTAALKRFVQERRLVNAIAEQQAYDAVAQAILPNAAQLTYAAETRRGR